MAGPAGTTWRQAWEQALTLLPARRPAAAWCRRGRQFRTVVCHPEASLAAYRTAEALLTPQSPAPDPGRDADRAGLGRGGGRRSPRGRTACSPRPARIMRPSPTRKRQRHRRDPDAGPDPAGPFRRVRRRWPARGPGRSAWAGCRSRAYAVWINAACALACVGDDEAALALADRALSRRPAGRRSAGRLPGRPGAPAGPARPARRGRRGGRPAAGVRRPARRPRPWPRPRPTTPAWSRWRPGDTREAAELLRRALDGRRRGQPRRPRRWPGPRRSPGPATRPRRPPAARPRCWSRSAGPTSPGPWCRGWPGSRP